MNFIVVHHTVRNLIRENQKRKICAEADALASSTGKEDPPFLQLPRVMSEVVASQNHRLLHGGLRAIQEGKEGEETHPKTINCPRCGQNINWCECPTKS